MTGSILWLIALPVPLIFFAHLQGWL